MEEGDKKGSGFFMGELRIQGNNEQVKRGYFGGLWERGETIVTEEALWQRNMTFISNLTSD